MEQSHSHPSAAPEAALLRPPGSLAGVKPEDPALSSTAPNPDQVEPDGTEDPWSNADDGVLPEQPAPGVDPSPVFPKENHMHKPQDTPPVEVPPLDPTPPQDPIPHQNPTARR